jgi:glyceraldehyde 3-phosphate dehydrogenase
VTRVGINGFGRMGRLAFRAGWESPDLVFAHVNEIAGDAATAAHLLTFDSVHGRFGHDVAAEGATLRIDETSLTYGRVAEPGDVPWDEHGVEVVLECTGRFRTRAQLDAYFGRGVRKIIVAAPVKEGALNIVVGDVITAASCTMNCLAPVVKVIHEGLGILLARMAGASLTAAGAR